MDKEITDYKFEVESPAKITVRNIRGNVDIKQGDSKEISVQVIKYPNTGNDDETKFEVTQDSDNSVKVSVEFQDKGFFRIRRPCRLDFIVVVPENCQVKASNVSGNIDLENVSGDHRLKTVSGNVTFSGISAEDLTVKSVSGSIKGNSTKSTMADLGAVSGSINLSGMEVDRLDVSNVSGSIKFEGALGSGRHDVGTVSGSIHLQIPEDTNLEFKASSISGKLKSDLNIKYTSLSRNRWIGTLNAGGNPMKLKTVSGSMNINAN